MAAIARDIFNTYLGKHKIDGRTANYVKALSLSIFIKNICPKSFIKDFTYNKLHKMTGLHITTLQKYIRILRELGYAKFIGKRGTTLLFTSITSDRKWKRIDLSNIVFDSVKDVEQSLMAMAIVEIQRQKDFVKQVAIDLKEPSDLEALKKAKKINKAAHGRYENFHDNGISIKTIAKRLGVHTQKALKIVAYAVKYEFLEKTRNVINEYIPNALLSLKYGECDCTFATKNNLYTVYANTYSIGGRLSTPLGIILDGEK